MAQTQTIELPTDVYDALTRAASDSRTTPAGWIALHLPEDELAGWDMEELRRMLAVSQEYYDRGEYMEFDSEEEMTQFILARVDARAATKG